MNDEKRRHSTRLTFTSPNTPSSDSMNRKGPTSAKLMIVPWNEKCHLLYCEDCLNNKKSRRDSANAHENSVDEDRSEMLEKHAVVEAVRRVQDDAETEDTRS